MILALIILLLAVIVYILMTNPYFREELTNPPAGANCLNYNGKEYCAQNIPLSSGIEYNDSESSGSSTSDPSSSSGFSSSGSSSSGSDTNSSGSGSSGSSSSGSLSGWKQKILDYHNNIRAQCSPDNPPLTWDDDLATYAENYSIKAAAAKQCNHTYGGHNSYNYSGYSDGAGENLYCNEGGQANVTNDSLALASVNAWAGEGYGADASPDADETGHYTAMNWKGSTKLGCGIGRDSSTGWAVVTCNYADSAANYCCTGSQFQSLIKKADAQPYWTTSGSTSSFDAYGYYLKCSKPLSVQN